MKIVSFGKVLVATSGTPVQLGTSILGAAVTPGDTVITISNPGVFSPDMLPFHLDIDPNTASREGMTVTAIASNKFTVKRGSNPIAHLINAPVNTDFRITGFLASASDTNAGKAYLGTTSMATGGGAGTIKKFAVTATGAADDSLQVMLNSQDGDPGLITDYKIDVATSNDGLNFLVFVR